MKKNRKTTKRMSVVAAYSVRFGAIVLSLFIMVSINQFASFRGTQLMKTIGEKRRELKTLEESYQREQSRWEGMCTPEKIDAALLANGMKMSLPRHEQCIRMKRDGIPVAGQISVAKARQRNGGNTAKYQRRKR